MFPPDFVMVFTTAPAEPAVLSLRADAADLHLFNDVVVEEDPGGAALRVARVDPVDGGARCRSLSSPPKPEPLLIPGR